MGKNTQIVHSSTLKYEYSLLAPVNKNRGMFLDLRKKKKDCAAGGWIFFLLWTRNKTLFVPGLIARVY